MSKEQLQKNPANLVTSMVLLYFDFGDFFPSQAFRQRSLLYREVAVAQSKSPSREGDRERVIEKGRTARAFDVNRRIRVIATCHYWQTKHTPLAESSEPF